MSARYWHDKDHKMPECPDGVDKVTGATYFGDVLAGRKSVGQALWEAAQTGYHRPAPIVETRPAPAPEPSYVEPEVEVHRGAPEEIAKAILRKVRERDSL